MSAPRFTPQERQELHDLASRWAQIVSKRASGFGDDGPGLDVNFKTSEPITTVAAQGPAQGTPQLLLQQQGTGPADHVIDW